MKTLKQLLTEASRQGSFSVDQDTVNEIGDWIVGPVGRERDYGTIAESNWQVATERLLQVDPDQNDHRVLRFGHFAVGWVEELATRPGSECARRAENMRESLEGYPILDEMHHSCMVAGIESDNWHQIERELRDQVREYATEHWDDWDDKCDDRLDDLDLSEIASEYGESDGEGWRKYSTWDVENIAKKVAEQFGLDVA